MPHSILPKLNYKNVAEGIHQFLKGEFKKRKRTSAVVGISGGVDSTLVAMLCERAGLDLRAVFMPYGKLSKPERVKKLIKDFSEVDITKVVDEQIKLIEKSIGISLDKIDKGNIMARQRMVILYSLARQLNGLVVGTENLSEYYLGYFTRHGDQSADINPITSLWKSQVMELAEYLGLSIKKPSAELWEGQTDEKELGFSYKLADPILYLYCLEKVAPERIIREFDFNKDLVYRVIERVKSTEYKRREVPQYEGR